jgi:uncharacterized metal-binding protein
VENVERLILDLKRDFYEAYENGFDVLRLAVKKAQIRAGSVLSKSVIYLSFVFLLLAVFVSGFVYALEGIEILILGSGIPGESAPLKFGISAVLFALGFGVLFAASWKIKSLVRTKLDDHHFDGEMQHARR